MTECGGEARANTRSVLTPGGDVIKESIGAFPRVILAEGEYRVVNRNDARAYEGNFKVVKGVDREVEASGADPRYFCKTSIACWMRVIQPFWRAGSVPAASRRCRIASARW